MPAILLRQERLAQIMFLLQRLIRYNSYSNCYCRPHPLTNPPTLPPALGEALYVLVQGQSA